MKTNITYSRDTHIAAVGPSVWAKLGPEDWFDSYKLVAANSRNYQADFVIDLAIQAEDIEQFTTQNIIETPQFKAIANGELAPYQFIAYRPVEIPEGLTADRFIANDIIFSRFEDKKIFRELFDGLIPIPKYTIISLTEFLDQDAGEMYETYRALFGGDTFVAQDNVGGGGRGTFIIRSIQDVEEAVEVLRAEHKGTYVVLSQFVSGIERSAQTFISPSHTVKGPLQQQLVRNPELLDPNGRGGMYFCGGKFIYDASDHVKDQVVRIIETVSSTLRASDYIGIFGVDFLLDQDENVYVLEINARTTGLLPLLNEHQSELPLYLLHILELARKPYQIESPESVAEPYLVSSGPRSFVTLFNTSGHRAHFDSEITTGNYKLTDAGLEQIDDRARWHADADVMLQLFCAADFPAKPNLKLANIFLKNGGFSETGELDDITRRVVNYLKAHTVSIGN
jgi:hypothetical protein